MSTAYIFDAVRTPRGRGKASGSLNRTRPVTLLDHVLRASVERNKLPVDAVDDVILGCVAPIGEQGGNISKLAAQYAGLGDRTAGVQLNRFCSSGLEAINQAACAAIAGYTDLSIAGGVESMSRVPMMSDGGSWMIDPDVHDKTHFVPQGISADLLATIHGYSRKDADEFALESQKRAGQAWQEGRFQKSIIPIVNELGETILAKDEHMRPESTMDDMTNLKPSFQEMGEKYGFDAITQRKYPQIDRINHIHHAGNSSGIVDGAAAVLIGNDFAKDKYGLTPRAKIRSMALTSTEPTIMLTGPAPATKLALEKAHLKASDIDLFEINEAFAAVVLLAMRELDIDHSKVNINGGAIALGHPLGATGAMLLGTALDELERQDKALAAITLCVGGGMGVTTIIERI